MVNNSTKIHKQYYKNKCKQNTQTTKTNVNDNVDIYKRFENSHPIFYTHNWPLQPFSLGLLT